MRSLNVVSYQEEGGVATVSVTSQINTKVIADLETICAHLEDESPCDVVVFQGSDEHFTRGIDLDEFDLGKPLDIHGFHKWEKALTWIERLNKATIAVLRGRCVGAGMHLGLVCDLRLASHDARVGLDEVKRGFLPGMSTFRLAKYVGLGRAKTLTITGRVLDAGEAERWGLVDRVVARAELDAALAAMIEEVRPVNPVALELNRRLLNESYAIQYEEFIGNFLAAQHRAIISEAFLELLTQAKKEA